MANIVTTCPHCGTRHVAFPIKWAAPADINARFWNCAATCGSCGGPVCFRVRNRSQVSSSPEKHNGVLDDSWVLGPVWPSISDSQAPKHTPPAVARRFIEGENAFKGGSWNAAVAMYRSALDIATKAIEGVPAKETFYKRTVWLNENHLITPAMRDWADHVRIEGNEALHDPDDFTEEDAEPLRLFTETFLRYMFELPGEVEAFRSRQKGVE